jgi:hypothetical protein
MLATGMSVCSFCGTRFSLFTWLVSISMFEFSHWNTASCSASKISSCPSS